jgi:uncharacterized membrane protein
MTLAAHAIVVDRPVDEVYDAWSDRPALSLRLGDGIEVEPLDDALTRWTVPWGGVQHQIVVREIATATRRDVVWMSVSGPRLAGRVAFLPLGEGSTCVRMSVDFDPRNPLGYLADTLGVPDRAVERVLQHFQASMSSATTSSGAAGIETPGASPHARGHAR